jgi:hypothetical protein
MARGLPHDVDTVIVGTSHALDQMLQCKANTTVRLQEMVPPH